LVFFSMILLLGERSESSIVNAWVHFTIRHIFEQAMSRNGVDPFSSISMIDCLAKDSGQQLALDIRRGLCATPKTLSSKYFYDARGSMLFEKICCLPEYYLTRCEIEALQTMAPDILQDVSGTDFVELGSGASRKIKVILEAADRGQRRNIRYIPVDVSGEYLRQSALELVHCFPEVSVQGVVADFTRHLEVLPNSRQRVFFFLGSTLGNLTDEEILGFLSDLAGNMKPGDHLLLGLDMLKSRDVLERAYNDSKGVTAAFNKNILYVINKGLKADFDPELFDHLAFFNQRAGRMEMHLLARQEMEVNVADLRMRVPLRQGEAIHTEISRKFSSREIEELMPRAGLCIKRWVSDQQAMFSLLDLILASPCSS